MAYDMTPGACLVRPRLLAAAAKAGAAMYRRERDLAAALQGAAGGRDVVARLAAAEAQADAERREQAPSYSAARHVKLLAALMAEMALARAAIPAAA